MQIIEALVLGLLQGVTEFIPVSSSGHLVLAEQLFNFEVSGFVFDAVLNLGTIAALVIYFRQDLGRMIKGVFSGGHDRRLAWLVILGTLPAVIAGIFLQSFTESAFRSTYVVAAALVIVALVMLIIEKVAKFTRPLVQMKPADSLAIGLIQVAAFIPGVSRSGATITAGMARGLKREAAARFSFLLSIPVLLGGTIKVLLEPTAWEQVTSKPLLFTVGILAAFASGYLAVSWLLRYLAANRLTPFAYYRIGLAAIILLVTLLS
ncbi:undecaprenyl-diphosphate phosphatase [Candidatus Microgenomates bacterium]|nr:undecaprenyl-diphosphate phosphatase [Candidatus Microgenomates bacterium]